MSTKERFRMVLENGEPVDFPVGATVPVSSLEVHGHSWAAGFGVTAQQYNFPQRLAKLLGGVPLTTAALSGAMAGALAADGGTARVMQNAGFLPELAAGPYFGTRGLKMAVIGSNEYIGYNVASGGAGSAGAAAVTERTLAILYSYLRGARQINYNAAGHVKSSGIGAAGDATLCMGTGYNFASANGETIDLFLDANYRGEAFTLPIPHFSAYTTTGRWVMTLDPAGANTALGTYDGAAFDATLKAIGKSATLGHRFPKGAIPAGSHTIRLTSAGLTGSNFITYNGAIVEGESPLILPLFPRRPSSLSSTALFVWANDRIRAAAATFTNTLLVDTNKALAPNYGTAQEADDEIFWFDAAHVNNLGAGRIASAVLDELPGFLTPAMAGLMT